MKLALLWVKSIKKGIGINEQKGIWISALQCLDKDPFNTKKFAAVHYCCCSCYFIWLSLFNIAIQRTDAYSNRIALDDATAFQRIFHTFQATSVEFFPIIMLGCICMLDILSLTFYIYFSFFGFKFRVINIFFNIKSLLTYSFCTLSDCQSHSTAIIWKIFHEKK